MKRLFTLMLMTTAFITAQGQIIPVRTVVSSLGKDTLIGKTNWAFTVGEAIIETYAGTDVSFTQGFHQPDGYALSPFLPAVNSIIVYPNPITVNSVLRFYLKVDKPSLSINIYDAIGRLCETQTLQSYAGQTYHSLNTHLKASGTYEIRITVGAEKYVARFIVAN